jgi:hypothetical protein
MILKFQYTLLDFIKNTEKQKEINTNINNVSFIASDDDLMQLETKINFYVKTINSMKQIRFYVEW